MTIGAVAAGVSAAATVAGTVMSATSKGGGISSAQDAQTQAQMLQMQQKDAALHAAQSYMSPYETTGNAAQQKLAGLLGIATPLQAPNRADFNYTDTLGTQRFDDAGYKQAMRDFAQQVSQYGMPMPQAPNRKAFATGADFRQAKKTYKTQLQKYYADITNPQTLAKLNTQTSGPESGSLLKNFDMEQYKQEPGYTPMVNDLASLQATPGYQFRLQQGEQGLNRTAAAQGGLLSGAAAKAMDRYNQDFASNEYQNAWQRAQAAYGAAFARNQGNRQLTYNMLSGQGTQGMQAANTMGGNAMQAGQLGAQISGDYGNNSATLALAQGQNNANMWTGLGNSVAGLASGWGTPSNNTTNNNPNAPGILNVSTKN
jgi:hypothetical protein